MACLQVDRLSVKAQSALRRTMEKYSVGCRLILSCNSACRVIEPVRSRCMGVRVPAPSYEDIATVLSTVAKAERAQLPPEFAMKVRISRPHGCVACCLLLLPSTMLHTGGGSMVPPAALAMPQAVPQSLRSS